MTRNQISKSHNLTKPRSIYNKYFEILRNENEVHDEIKR
jgi:hypothetical protein